MKYIITSFLSMIFSYLLVALFTGHIFGYNWEAFDVFGFFVLWIAFSMFSIWAIDYQNDYDN